MLEILSFVFSSVALAVSLYGLVRGRKPTVQSKGAGGGGW